MMQKRLFTVLLTVGLLLGIAWPTQAEAAQPQAAVTVAFDQAEYAPGATATAQIRVSAEADIISLSGVQFHLAKPEGAELQSLTMDPDGVLASHGELDAENGIGVYCQYGTEAVSVDSSGILLAEAQFRVTGSPNSTVQLQLDECILLEADGTEISAQQTPGQFSVALLPGPEDPVLTLLVDGAETAICKVGDIVTVTLTLTGEADSFAIAGLGDTITFDPDRFELLPDTVTASVGTATAKETSGIYDRVYFQRYGMDSVTLPCGTVLASFQLRVKQAGVIAHKNPTRSDDSANALPIGQTPAQVSLYDASSLPLAWTQDGASLRNYSDETVTVSLYLASYAESGQMQRITLLSQIQLAGGAQFTPVLPADAVPSAGTSKLLAVSAAFTPLALPRILSSTTV